jgi:hypothetical protein
MAPGVAASISAEKLMLPLAGTSRILFLLIAVVGNISGKIEAGPRGRLASAVLGGCFVLLGLAIHFADSTGVKSAPPLSPLPQSETTRGTEFQTNFEGIVAGVDRFEKTGNLLTLELGLHNMSDDPVKFCAESKWARLIDESDGTTWRPVEAGGHEGCASIDKPYHDPELAPNATHIAWMKFAVRSPERKVFSLSIEGIPRPIDGLRVERN